MDLGLSGKRALVGGGGSGLGGGIATVLVAEGARVAIIGRTEDRIRAEAARLGGIPVVADLATSDGPAMAVEAAVTAMGVGGSASGSWHAPQRVGLSSVA